jgi:hypothetical protein
MDTTHEAGTKQGLLRRWPVTTIAGLGGVASLTALLATSSPESSVEVLVTKDVEVEARAMSREELAAPERVAGSAAKPGSALRGPKEGSPAGGATAVGHGVDDVWGGLSGSAIGEAYGVGGLGLVGTGRGGGGTGEGTIGLGTISLAGKGRYDSSLQSGVLTVGTVDDNADPAGYKKALKRMAAERRSLGIPEDMWQLTPREQRHDERPGGLDVALVIDTTGSMGDELEYLKVELRGIALEISRDFPDVEQRWGLVVYRDEGDDYVTQSGRLSGHRRLRRRCWAARRPAAAVTARGDGRGDGGELAPGVASGRRDGAGGVPGRRCADARRRGGEAFARSVREHRDAGTAIYPVGASGVDVQAEAQLRLAAKATGGQYIFLTDHSGIGGQPRGAEGRPVQGRDPQHRDDADDPEGARQRQGRAAQQARPAAAAGGRGRRAGPGGGAGVHSDGGARADADADAGGGGGRYRAPEHVGGAQAAARGASAVRVEHRGAGVRGDGRGLVPRAPASHGAAGPLAARLRLRSRRGSLRRRGRGRGRRRGGPCPSGWPCGACSRRAGRAWRR